MGDDMQEIADLYTCNALFRSSKGAWRDIARHARLAYEYMIGEYDPHPLDDIVVKRLVKQHE